MFGLGATELIIILLAIGILLFGSKKVVELARSFGRVSGEFKKGRQDMERELQDAEETTTGARTYEVSDDASSANGGSDERTSDATPKADNIRS